MRPCNRIVQIGLALGMFVFAGCSKKYMSSLPRPADYTSTKVQAASEGLFSTGDVSDAQIQEMLDYRLKLPSKTRVAWYEIESAEGRFWQANVADSLADVLRQSHRVFDASPLPALLFPQQITLAALRAASARFQADLLMIYTVRTRQIEKKHVLSEDEVKSLCNVEAVVLDTRSGLVIYSGAAARDFMTVKGEDDLKFEETLSRARDQAVRDALGQVGVGLTTFLDSEVLSMRD